MSLYEEVFGGEPTYGVAVLVEHADHQALLKPKYSSYLSHCSYDSLTCEVQSSDVKNRVIECKISHTIVVPRSFPGPLATVSFPPVENSFL